MWTEKFRLHKIYWIQFNKELAAVRKVHEIKVRVEAEHLTPQPRKISLLSQQPNQGHTHNNKKEIKTLLMNIEERTGIINKDIVKVEVTLIIVDHRPLAIVDPAALCHCKAFSSHKQRITKDNLQSPLNRKSWN